MTNSLIGFACHAEERSISILKIKILHFVQNDKYLIRFCLSCWGLKHLIVQNIDSSLRSEWQVAYPVLFVMLRIEASQFSKYRFFTAFRMTNSLIGFVCHAEDWSISILKIKILHFVQNDKWIIWFCLSCWGLKHLINLSLHLKISILN